MAGEAVEKRKITWKELWELEAFRMGFTVKSVYDVLTSPTSQWAPRPLHMVTQLLQVLSCFATVLKSQRTSWKNLPSLLSCQQATSFVQVGNSQTSLTTIRPDNGQLSGARDWNMLGQKLCFPFPSVNIFAPIHIFGTTQCSCTGANITTSISDD